MPPSDVVVPLQSSIPAPAHTDVHPALTLQLAGVSQPIPTSQPFTQPPLRV